MNTAPKAVSVSSVLVHGESETLAGRIGFVNMAGFTLKEMENCECL